MPRNCNFNYFNNLLFFFLPQINSFAAFIQTIQMKSFNWKDFFSSWTMYKVIMKHFYCTIRLNNYFSYNHFPQGKSGSKSISTFSFIFPLPHKPNACTSGHILIYRKPNDPCHLTFYIFIWKSNHTVYLPLFFLDTKLLRKDYCFVFSKDTS